MNRKQKKELRRHLSTRQLMGIDQLTEHGLKTAKGELVFFLLSPDNLSVLSSDGVRNRVRALTDLLRGLDAAELLASQGVEAEVVKLHRIAPLDPALVLASVRRTGRLLVLEDCNENGSIGQQLASALAQAGVAPRALILKNLKNAFAPQGTVAQLRRLLKLDAESVAEQVREML